MHLNGSRDSRLRTAREITVSFTPLTPPSPLRRGEEDAVNYFSNGPYILKSSLIHDC